jgi:hypothetical protein
LESCGSFENGPLTWKNQMLESRNLFVDTQVFKHQNYHFNQKTLQRLQELGANGMVQIVLTETVIGEVKAHLKIQISSASNTLTEFRKLAGPLESQLPDMFKSLPARLDKDELIQIGIREWDAYVAKSKAVVLSASSIDASNLLFAYFNAMPPFGPGAKKDEFPDAISMLSLQFWLEGRKENIYVVSDDADLARWCELTTNAFHLKTLAEFFDLFNRSEEVQAELVHKLFKKEEQQFLDRIKDQFCESGFTYADNWDAEVDSVVIRDMTINEINLIEIESDTATFSVMVRIKFDASISGPDYENGSWDSEEKEYMYLPTFHIQHEFDETYEVGIEFLFDTDKKEVEDIVRTDFEAGSDITLSIDDGYPWK